MHVGCSLGIGPCVTLLPIVLSCWQTCGCATVVLCEQVGTVLRYGGTARGLWVSKWACHSSLLSDDLGWVAQVCLVSGLSTSKRNWLMFLPSDQL